MSFWLISAYLIAIGSLLVVGFPQSTTTGIKSTVSCSASVFFLSMLQHIWRMHHLVVHSLNADSFHLEGELLGSTRSLMPPSPSPHETMLVCITVGSCRFNRLHDLLPILEAFAFKSQRT